MYRYMPFPGNQGVGQFVKQEATEKKQDCGDGRAPEQSLTPIGVPYWEDAGGQAPGKQEENKNPAPMDNDVDVKKPENRESFIQIHILCSVVMPGWGGTISIDLSVRAEKCKPTESPACKNAV